MLRIGRRHSLLRSCQECRVNSLSYLRIVPHWVHQWQLVRVLYHLPNRTLSKGLEQSQYIMASGLSRTNLGYPSPTTWDLPLRCT